MGSCLSGTINACLAALELDTDRENAGDWPLNGRCQQIDAERILSLGSVDLKLNVVDNHLWTGRWNSCNRR
jgi:hypothetical protein